MSLFTDRKDFFKSLAEQHYQVLHGYPVPDGGGMLRKSFIHIENPEELSASVINQLHFPVVLHINFSGKPMDKQGSVRVRIVNELMFLDQPVLDPGTPTTDIALEAAYNRSFAVMMDFISWMYNEYEEEGSCGPFKDIDLNLFNWRMQDYINDGLVGWVLEFADEVKANDIVNFDENKWIAPAP